MNRSLRTQATPLPRAAVGVARARLQAGVWFGVLLALLLVQMAGMGHRVRHPAPQWHTGWQAGWQSVRSQGPDLVQVGATTQAATGTRGAAAVSQGTVHDEAQCRLLDALSLGDAGPSALIPLVLLATQFAVMRADPVSTPCLAAPWRRQARAPPA